MKKSIFIFTITLFTIFSINICAEEKSQFFYGEASSMGAVPMLGMGFRTQNGIHGFDLSGGISCIPLLTPNFSDRFSDRLKVFRLKSLYLIYPKQTGVYLGTGLGILNEPETVKLSGSVEGVIGYQWKNQTFLQGSAVAPFNQSSAAAPVWPALSFGMGF